MDKKLPILQYIILCDDIAIYQDSNKLAILGVFEQIYVQQLPTQHQKLWLLTRFSAGKGNFNVHNKIMNPQGEYIFESEVVNFTLEQESANYDINGQLIGLPLETEGTYWIETYLDNNLLSRVPFQVLTNPPEPIQHKEITYH